MNINCVICSDLFVPTAEVYITKCGHMFHFHCLAHWIERSQTCPQCRNKTTDKTIHKVYFNLANTDGCTEDAGTLQNKVHDLQFQITLKEKDIKLFSEKYSKAKAQNIALREEIKELEDKCKSHESAIHGLKDRMVYLKSKSKDNDKLTEEVAKLKTRVKDMENIHLAVTGSKEDVNEMLRNEKNVESLALLSAILKKSLIDAERKKREMEHNLKRAQNEAAKYRRDYNTLDGQNSDLKKELHQLKTCYENEKRYLKNKIADLDKKISSTDKLDITNTSLNRIILESPINFNRKPRLMSPEDGVRETESPSMVEKVQKILDSNSPYLPVKASNLAVDYNSILNTKFQSKSGSSKSGFTIFKAPPASLEHIKLPTNTSGISYNGLGGTSKEDVYPTPKPRETGLKRPKSCATLTSNKFRKLAPTATKTKVTSFFSQRDSQ
ncbi:hypothetical protein NQ318_001246 [Aromia moschata]|uniref:RING-type domain-containing protein n=1 Tax=Aromia moschata TaxID=1265417 RepID=A0AAV8ZEM8_9CUCU|nr:hypothetical protein NQ318_001246 [Aromia moschata]